MDLKAFKHFLSLFQYGIDNEKKKESIKYIIDRMQEAEKSKSVLTFDKLAEIDFSPNPCLDRNGNLYINTRIMYEMFDSYLKDKLYIETEIANLEREKILALHDIAVMPLSNTDVDI